MDIRGLARSVSAETGYNQSDCEAFIRALGYVFEKELMQHGKSRLPGIGSFKVKLLNVNGYDFKSEEVKEIRHVRIQYQPTRALKVMLKSASDITGDDQRVNSFASDMANKEHK